MRFHNCNFTVRPDETGVEISVPGLLDTNAFPVMPLLRYQVNLFMKGFSQTHLQKVREAVRLFAQYSMSNRPLTGFGTGEVGPVQEVRHWEHFRNFRHAILFGTFGPDGLDPSCLCWVPKGVNKANDVVRLLTDFFIYLDELDKGDRAARFNPVVTPTNYEALYAASAYEFRRNKALLGHTWAQPGEAVQVHRAVTGRDKKPATKEVKRIYDSEFERLLRFGFDTSTEVGLRDSMLSILMNKTGVRVSEALGAWVVDVIDDPAGKGSAHVKLRHPGQAKVKIEHKGVTYTRRTDYLKGAFGLPDRTKLLKSDPQHLGWKGRFDVLELYWAEPWWGRVFWRMYMEYLRRTAMKRAGKHPYLFIDSESCGPLAYDTFSKSYTRAVYRAGLVPAGMAVSLKDSGLTSHGNRHAYGERLKVKYGCSEKVVQNAMHHASPESQLVYTIPSGEQTKRAIEEGLAKMRRHSRELEEMKGALSHVRPEIMAKTREAGSLPNVGEWPDPLRAFVDACKSA